MGALAGLGKFSWPASLGLALSATLASDLIWFQLGRVQGQSILNLLCRVSLEPDSCVSNTKNHFRKYGALALLFAKFVPGLNTVAAPLSGLTRMPLVKFIAADTGGVIAWAGSFLAIGYFFRDQLELVAEQVEGMGSWIVLVAALLLAAYIAWKYYQRRRFIHGLRVARVTPEDLMKMIESGADVAVVDLRSSFEIELDNTKLPGAIWLDLENFDGQQEEIPRDKDVILYCS